MLSIGQALVSATGFFGRGPVRQASGSSPVREEAEWVDSDEAPEPPTDSFSRGAPCFDAVEAALKDAGYLDF